MNKFPYTLRYSLWTGIFKLKYKKGQIVFTCYLSYNIDSKYKKMRENKSNKRRKEKI
ncbi:hypothetical protein UT300018_21340 [Clostridium faecium]